MLYADAAGRGRCRAALPSTTAGGMTVWPTTNGAMDWCASWTERQADIQPAADPDPEHKEPFL